MGYIFGTLLVVLAIFLILLVLVQRGRGGGLTGALGGMGGSSAFGAKAGDVFTRITIITAGIWICVCAAAFYWANHRGDRLGSVRSSATTSLPGGPGLIPPATTKAPAPETSGAGTSGDATPPPATNTGGENAAAPPTSDTPPPQQQ
jgi:preprotein translocase subunit SecG